MTFYDEIIEEISFELARTVKIRNAAVGRLLEEIVELTPVGDPYGTGKMQTPWKSLPKESYEAGTLRANWMVSIDSDENSFDSSKQDTDGKATVIDGKRVIRSALRGDTIIISNHAPYAARVEYGTYSPNGPSVTAEGFSDQAPAGMLNLSVQRFETIVQEEDAKVRAKKRERDEIMLTIKAEMKRILGK
jgi:hypothetical protein